MYEKKENCEQATTDTHTHTKDDDDDLKVEEAATPVV